MSKGKVDNEAINQLKNMDADAIEIALEAANREDDKRKDKINTLVKKKFIGVLKDKSYGLKRSEKKKLKDVDLSSFSYMEDDVKDELIDKLLELRGISEAEADELSVGDVSLWAELIVARTLNPIEFEGK